MKPNHRIRNVVSLINLINLMIPRSVFNQILGNDTFSRVSAFMSSAYALLSEAAMSYDSIPPSIDRRYHFVLAEGNSIVEDCNLQHRELTKHDLKGELIETANKLTEESNVPELRHIFSEPTELSEDNPYAK